MTDKYTQYTTVSYNGRKLLEKHGLNTVGFWRIRGEDPNCDMGGHHYQPELGMFEGKLKDIIAYAVDLPSFWAWGGGGDITLVSQPKKITSDSTKERAALVAKQLSLKAALKVVEEELEAL